MTTEVTVNPCCPFRKDTGWHMPSGIVSTAHQKTTLQHLLAGIKDDSPRSSLGFSQGAASPPLPNGMEQGAVSVVQRQKKARRADEATAIATCPRPRERKGAIANFKGV